MGFSKHWPKLDKPTFTTFRLPRRDKDWMVGERVLPVIQPRKKGGGEILSPADIVWKEEIEIRQITLAEAVEDGFNSVFEMIESLSKANGDRLNHEPLHKLTLTYLTKKGTK